VENSGRPAISKRSAIWAINLNWLEQTGSELLGAVALDFAANADRKRLAEWENSLISECREPVIIKINSLKINKRLAAQQGVFLCRLFHEAFFESDADANDSPHPSSR